MNWMQISSLLRTSTLLALCLILAVPVFSQSGGSQIGPSKGEIIGIVAGVAAAITVVGILIYHQAHKHASIAGCVTSGPDGLNLKNQKDKKVYALSGDLVALKAGEQVALKGKKGKNSNGKLIFQVNELTQDYGPCHP